MQKKDLQLRFTSVCLLRFYLRGFIGAGARAEWSAGLGALCAGLIINVVIQSFKTVII